MGGSRRIGTGLLTDAARPVRFRFDGREMQGLAGDTLASALLASGTQLLGRSFKYHRPRGVVTAGPEEPCALVDVIGPAGREPNRLATTLELHDGLVVESQNRWPSLRFDVLGINDLLSRFLPAGFYYKTFMAPGWAWERVYEPFIRRAAGLGRLEAIVGDHADPAETVHDHTDVLVIGAGTAGLAATQALGARGVRVMLVEQDATLGGGSLLDWRWNAWREQVSAQIRAMPSVRALVRTAVLGAYGHGVFAALETLSAAGSAHVRARQPATAHAGAAQAASRAESAQADAAQSATRADSAPPRGLRERLHVIRAKRVILATGAVERIIAFPGNDVPGVMLAGAALAYLRRYGVAVGTKPVFFVNSDEAYEVAFAMIEAGIRPVAIVDPRETARAEDRARSLGVEVFSGAVISAVSGRHEVRGVTVSTVGGQRIRNLAADALLISGGYSPATALATQLGAQLEWDDGIAAFTPKLAETAGRVVGAAHGMFGMAAAAREGDTAARAIASELGVSSDVEGPELNAPADAEFTPTAALWVVRAPGKAFVDLQNDVTTQDVRLAHREGYEHIEHMKRYTTHGMATDQGRIGGLVGSAVLAEARGVPLAEVGQLKPRPYAQPVPFAALAGGEVREHFKPKRRTPLHDWHEAAGATFVNAGIWLRPLVYSRHSGWEPVLQEARAVRQRVGVTDVSTLGKIDVQGPDAARFLDFIYANSFSTLAVGRARYGIMLREDGMMFDDGTTARLGPQHFLITTTTANASAVLEHMEFQLQANCRDFDVVLTDVGDQWAQFAVAGPRSRDVLARVVEGVDLENAAFPFMAASAARIAGVEGRLFRISFSGEMAYEVAVPARDATAVWTALLDAGKADGITPYGLDALNTLRIEKGHVTGAELNGNTNADDLGFGRMLKKNGDFIGRTLAQRPGMRAIDRLQLVGVRPVNPMQRLRNGTHLVDALAPSKSLGYVTSSTPSVELEGWVGLALLTAGRSRIGERMLCVSPVHDLSMTVEIVSPHFLDPENTRVRG